MNIAYNNAAAQVVGDMLIDARMHGVLSVGNEWGVFWEGSCYATCATLDAAVAYYKKMVAEML